MDPGAADVSKTAPSRFESWPLATKGNAMNPLKWWRRTRILQDIENTSEDLRKVISLYYEMPPSSRKSDPLARARLELAAAHRAELIRLKAIYRTLC